MERITNILVASAAVICCSCGSPTEIQTGDQADSVQMNAGVVDSTEWTMGSALAGHDEGFDQDTMTVIPFEEMTITINRLIVYDEEQALQQMVPGDTVVLWVELGETVEGQEIAVTAPGLKNISVEQRYETSISVSAEGPHCDLVDWKHFDSGWKIIHPLTGNNYQSLVYTHEERTKFPEVNAEEVNKELEKLCPEFLDQVEGVTSIHDYPYQVSISRVYFRITGEMTDSGEAVEKVIVFDIPMGC